MLKMSRSLYENQRGSPTLTSLGVLGVLNVLNVLNVIYVLHMLHVLHGRIVGLLGLVSFMREQHFSQSPFKLHALKERKT